MSFLKLFPLLISFSQLVLGLQEEVVLNERPIIGILAQEIYNGESNTPNNSYIAASYIKFVEGGGAQAVPILIQQNDSYIEEIFSKINGVLFPGGSVLFTPSVGSGGYVDTGRKLLSLAKKANERGDFFPVWGTCLGFEFLVFDDLNGLDVMSSCSAWNIPDRLKYTKDAMTSSLFSKAPKSVVSNLATEPLTVNFHHQCLTPENYSRYGVDKNWKSLSINRDNGTGIIYVSSLEHRKYPFYGVQFHPEKNLYEWTEQEKIPHSPKAVKAAQYFANFFVSQARKNTHKFSNQKEENEFLIYNYAPIFSGAEGSTLQQKYFFPLKLN